MCRQAANTARAFNTCALSTIEHAHIDWRDAPLSARCLQLAGYSLLIYVPMSLWVNPNLLYGWSPLTWIVAFLGALGGILIGLVINYCDSIVKNLALSCAIIVTAVLDSLWYARAFSGGRVGSKDVSGLCSFHNKYALRSFQGPMTLPIIAAAGSVIISILNYTSG